MQNIDGGNLRFQPRWRVECSLYGRHLQTVNGAVGIFFTITGPMTRDSAVIGGNFGSRSLQTPQLSADAFCLLGAFRNEPHCTIQRRSSFLCCRLRRFRRARNWRGFRRRAETPAFAANPDKVAARPSVARRLTFGGRLRWGGLYAVRVCGCSFTRGCVRSC